MARAVPKARKGASNGTATLEPETEGPRSKRALILTAAIEKFGKDGYEHTKWATIADQVTVCPLTGLPSGSVSSIATS